MSFTAKRKDRGTREQKSYVSPSGVGHPTAASTDREEQPGSSSRECSNHEISNGRPRSDEEKSVALHADGTGRREEALKDGYPTGAEQATVDQTRAVQKIGVSESDGALYAELPINLVILKTKDRGRGIWTTEDVKAGVYPVVSLLQ